MKQSAKWLLVIALFLLSACPASEEQVSGTSDSPAVLRMGFIPSENMAELQKNVQPLVEKMSAALGMEVQPFIAGDYTGVVEALRNKRLEVAFLSAASYVMAKNEANVKVILRAQRGKDPFYYSVIFARKDSGLKDLKDLKGKTFAFGDNLSTAGYIYPLKMFKDQGINPESDFENTIFSGSHDATVLAVFNKKVTAGATYSNDAQGKDSAWKHILKPEQVDSIQVLAVSEAIPADNICVAENVSEEIQDKLRQFFLNLSKDPQGKALIHDLYHIDRFIEAKDADYAGIRKAFSESGINLKPQEKPQS